ncbi:MAG: methylated-DNA--[protein]-cysteine S-methyltransferase, partial [Pseudomonadota bacterium]
NRDVDRMVELAGFIRAHADQRLTLQDLAARQKLSPTYLQKAFKSVIGLSPKAYQDAVRLNRLKDLLRTGGDVTGAIFEAGYGSSSRVYEKAARHMGMTPKAYRAGGAGEAITYVCRDTSFGPLMMAATDKGVCFVMFGESQAALEKQLRSEFPHADLSSSPQTDAGALDAWMDALEAHLEQGAPRPEIPLDLRGTAFQMKVWRFLLSIPEGDVVSYSEVAAGIERPSAVRAAASACGKNRIAVLVPCHRVLRGDGGIGGYRWGVERKRALLDSERGADGSKL